MINRAWGRRLVSPAGLVLVLLCFGLPFLTVSCQTPVASVSVTYTGWDFAVGGQPDVVESGEASDHPDPRAEQTPATFQPLALVAVLLVVAGIAAAAARPPTRMVAGAVTGFLAAMLLVVNQGVVRGSMRQELATSAFLPPSALDNMIESRLGFWLALLLLFGVTGYNVAELFLAHRGPAAADPTPSTDPQARYGPGWPPTAAHPPPQWPGQPHRWPAPPDQPTPWPPDQPPHQPPDQHTQWPRYPSE